MNAPASRNLPLGLQAIGRLACQALAAGANANISRAPLDVRADYPVAAPSPADWVSLGDNLLALSKEFLSRTTPSVPGTGSGAYLRTVLLHALAQRHLAAANPNLLYSFTDYHATMCSFLDAMRTREVIEYHLHAAGRIRTVSNGATLAMTISSETSPGQIGSYCLAVDRIVLRRRAHTDDNTGAAVKRFASNIPLNDNSFVILVDKIETLAHNRRLTQLGRKNVYACGDLKHVHFVIFVADLLRDTDSQSRQILIPHIDYDGDDARISYVALRNLFTSPTSLVTMLNEPLPESEDDDLTVARHKVILSELIPNIMAETSLHAATSNTVCENRIVSFTRVANHCASRTFGRSELNGVIDEDNAGDTQKLAFRLKLPHSITKELDIFDEPNVPLSISRLARTFFGYNGIDNCES